MYQVAEYTSVNNLGTAVLLEALIEKPVRRLVVASSMSIYGEGLYRAPDGSVRSTVERSLEQLKKGDWQVRDENGEELTAIPTPESKVEIAERCYKLEWMDDPWDDIAKASRWLLELGSG